MKIKRIWIEYDDERGDSYMAPVTEADVIAWLAEKARSRRISPASGDGIVTNKEAG